MRIFIVLATLAGFLGQAFADTWHLEKDGDWQAVSESGQGRYLLAVADFKKLVSQGDIEAASEALTKLRTEFSDIVGPEFEAFVKAEMLFAKGKLSKASKSYDKFLDAYWGSELYDSALERQFQIGTAYLGGQKRRILKVFKLRAYDEGVKVMERIAERAGDSAISRRAQLAVARNYEKRGKFLEGHEKWYEISELWPAGDIAREALLGMARCMHAAYRGPKYDTAGLVSARDYYQEFKRKYPKEAKKIDVDSILTQITEQIAYKQYVIGEYYDRTGSKLAANLYYRQVQENWPDSTAAEFAAKAKQQSDREAKEQKE